MKPTRTNELCGMAIPSGGPLGLAMRRRGVSPLQTNANHHGRDARGTHGRDAHATSHVRPRRGGWMLVEVVVAFAILAIVLGGLVLTQRATQACNGVQLAREHCVAAGEAQLDRLEACGKAMDAAQIEDLWPGVRTRFSVSQGQGQWKGLKLVTVRVEGRAQGVPVSVELSRYYDRPLEAQP